MICICCLAQNVPYVELSSCKHGVFLNGFPVNNLNRTVPRVVCTECHVVLKKIFHFSVQVRQTFDILSDQNIDISRQFDKKSNFRKSKVVHFDVKLEPQPNVARIKNIETALDIINSNSAFIQPAPIIETILNLTKETLNKHNAFPAENKKHEKLASGENVSVKKEIIASGENESEKNGKDGNDIEEKVVISSIYGTAVLPEVKMEPDIEMLPFNEELHSGVLPENEEYEKVASDNNKTQINVKMKRRSNDTMEIVNMATKISKLYDNRTSTQETETKNNDLFEDKVPSLLPITNILPELNNCDEEVKNMSMLPVLKVEIKKEIVTDDYNAKLFPQIKNEFDIKMSPCSNSEENSVIKEEIDVKELESEVNNTKKSLTSRDINMTVLPIEYKELEMLPDKNKLNRTEFNGNNVGSNNSEQFTSAVTQNVTNFSMTNLSGANYPGANSSDMDSSGPTFSLKKIKLKKIEVLKERQEKLTSEEYLNCLYKCELCIIGFEFIANLNDHNKRKHVKKEGHIQCIICQQYVIQKDLREHEARHQKRIECRICSKRFVLNDEALLHHCCVPSTVRAQTPRK